MSSESELDEAPLAGLAGLPMNPQQLAAAERWLLADELLSHVRHKVCNKLASARNAAFFIRRSLEKSAFQADARVPVFFKIIDDELGAAGQQVASGFNSSGGRNKFWPRSRTGLRECIDSALSLRPSPTGVSITVQCDEDPILSVRAVELIVAIAYLLDNACESTGDHGQITIVTGADAENITLSVSDSGEGFSPASAEQALEAFYTTKPGHLGLGLNVVQRILKDYGGRAVIDSVTSGARVSILLPRALTAPDP